MNAIQPSELPPVKTDKAADVNEHAAVTEKMKDPKADFAKELKRMKEM